MRWPRAFETLPLHSCWEHALRVAAQRQRPDVPDRAIGLRAPGLFQLGWRRSRATTLTANRARPTRNWRQMFDNKLKTPFIALIGAVALMASVPAFAQTAAPAAPAADAA